MSLRNRGLSQKAPPSTISFNNNSISESASFSSQSTTRTSNSPSPERKNRHAPPNKTTTTSSIPSTTSSKSFTRKSRRRSADNGNSSSGINSKGNNTICTKNRIMKSIKFTRDFCHVYRHKLMVQHQHLKWISLFFIFTLLLRYEFEPPSMDDNVNYSGYDANGRISDIRKSLLKRHHLSPPFINNIPIHIPIPTIDESKATETTISIFVLDPKRRIHQQSSSNTHHNNNNIHSTPDYGGLTLNFLVNEECLHDHHQSTTTTTNINTKNQTSLFDTTDTSTCPKGSFYAGRQIKQDPEAMSGHIHVQDGSGMIPYYAFDDDEVRAKPFPKWYKKHSGLYGREEEIGHCRRTSWHRMTHPTCNMFHELDIILEGATFISSGSYRDVFTYQETILEYDSKHYYAHEKDETILIEETTDLILKTSRTIQPFTYETYEFIRNDALIMERLTSSPRISNMYGHCGTSLLTESLPNEVEAALVPYDGHIPKSDLNDTLDVDVRNNIPISDKLGLALTMSEAMADLHGFKDGVIVHDDIQPAQFLWNNDGVMKLNDFNRAEVMLYDEENGKYCKYKNGRGGGDFRAPEEFADWPLDEKIDVFSMGNNMYAILTGLWPFYDSTYKEIAKKFKDGELPEVDPRYKTRSYEEGVLVDLMNKCWMYDPEERIDIFELVRGLREAIKESEKRRNGE